MLIGVDIGGTFTDLVVSVDGHLKIHKLLSTPANPAEAMLAGLAAITPGGLAALERVSHGSTVATNAILERKGAKTALITTKGFRDVLFIGRQHRPNLYALHPQLPPPLIPRDWCYEVPERLDHQGNTLTSLDMAALDRVIDAIAAEGIESVAVCFLYSYINAAHEQAVKQRLIERGVLAAWQIALSSDVLPEFREYERASTVALDAYVRPVMSRYLTTLEQQLTEGGKSVSLRIMKSDGGVMSAERARQQAVQTALSGPAAGVIGAYHIAKLAGYDHIITLDIGGTSTDVAICPGAPVRRPESEIDGLPLRIRLLDIETIGAGGGSIARLDAGGALRVGPESAGSTPGPICYGRGGTNITVSDANAVLSRLDPDHFLGGGMTLHLPEAQAAVNNLAGQMNLSSEAAAAGIIDIANVSIDRAVRRVSVARGYDPRHFTLMAFGGAGPLHACEVAERLQIPRVLIPRYPGVLCAFGLLVADVALDYSRSVLGVYNKASLSQMHTLLAEMITQAKTELTHEGIAEDDMIFRPTVDMRYQGQAYELSIPLLNVEQEPSSLADDFHAAHERTYGHALRGRAVEVVNLRLQAIGVVEKPVLIPETASDETADRALIGHKSSANGETMALYERDLLPIGAIFDGPALAFQFDSTVYVARGWRARVDGYRNLILEQS
ncbi:MAG: hydantoinase/oxoprolinase family protein [Chloroflexi bacterium]|nr:hydantoinase/oxoprolinase family protein [Chloroflexota bacterium]MCC6895835.1 hydantoinase/oxoprolinase family protein [Anaerolineae bacterium]